MGASGPRGARLKRWLCIALLCGLGSLRADPATTLGGLYGEDLEGKPFTMEARAAGKTVVVVFGFSKASNKACQAFEDAFWRDFGGDTRVAIATVAQLQGVPGFILPLIKGGMRKNAPAERYPWKWILRRDRTLWQEAVGYEGSKAPDEAYVSILEPKLHELTFRKHANYSPEAYAELKESLGLILDPPPPVTKKKKRK